MTDRLQREEDYVTDLEGNRGPFDGSVETEALEFRTAAPID